MGHNTLEADSLIFRIGERTILSDVYLKCETGDITGILGRNGSGKSSLLKIIFGTLKAESQSLRVNGSYARQLYKQKSILRYLPQHDFLPPYLKVSDAIKFYVPEQASQKKIEQDALLQKILYSRLRTLSGGEKRYLGALLVLNSRVNFVMLDEPFTNLFPLQVEQLKSHILDQSAHKGIIITDHIFEHVIGISTKLLMLRNGKSVAVKDRQELIHAGYLPKAAPEIQKPKLEWDLQNPSSRLNIDPQTIKELEIFKAEEGKMSLFELFDQSITYNGRQVLKQILSCPKTDPDEILAMQQVLKFLQGSPGTWESGISGILCRTVETYLDSDMEPLGRKGKFSAYTEGLWARCVSPSQYGALKFGLENLQKLLHEIKGLYSHHKAENLPYFLGKQLDPLKSFFALKKVNSFLGIRRFFYGQVYYYDKLFREALKEKLSRVLNCFYELDALLALAKSANRPGFCFPEFHAAPDYPLRIEGLFHPFLSDPVPNNAPYEQGKNFIFLTGPNMAGKTTFMKSCGLAIYLAHIGMAVPAKAMELSPYDCLFSSIHTEDNLSKGYSYFYSEVRRVKEAAMALNRQEKSFIMFDELFKGTNVKDAYEGALLVIGGFCNWPESTFLISSHLTELEMEIKKYGNIEFCCFEAGVKDDKPVFSYRLKKGLSRERLGLLILENENLRGLLYRSPKVPGPAQAPEA